MARQLSAVASPFFIEPANQNAAAMHLRIKANHF